MEYFNKQIVSWYKDNKRVLPWRLDKNPYHIWISEIMLQQTRIEAVKEYYKRFIDRIPNVYELSIISDDELLKLWQGLGYYNRAKNLKKAAQMIMNDYHGIFPNTYEELIKLPGIGEYTAGAISSIAFNYPMTAIDGNVMRVYTRYTNQDLDVSLDSTKKYIKEELLKIIPKESGNFNEGIMELGETVCLPNTTPDCEICPLASKCLAKKNNTQEFIPRKVIKQEKKEEKYTVLLLLFGDKIAIKKRTNSLLNGLYEFPNMEGFKTKKELQSIYGKKINKGIDNTHIFSHRKWIMKSFIIEPKEMDNDYIWVSFNDIENIYSIPTAFLPFYEELKKK